jgi:hypothetical protein
MFNTSSVTVMMLASYFFLAGCGDSGKSRDQSIEHHQSIDWSKLDDNTIVPGIGTKSLRVGMDISGLGPHWIRASELHPDLIEVNSRDLYNRDVSISIVERDGQIEILAYWFRADSIGSKEGFVGQTVEGIDSSSSVEDVIDVYGQPEVINASIANREYGRTYDPARDNVTFRYLSRGLLFNFTGGKLESIQVRTPDPKVDREYRHDSGDTSFYREIVISQDKSM